jgi:tryptophanyl-tRNA synthetase
MDAARSVGAVTTPIHEARVRLEQQIDQTWDMLRAQSVVAAARAEQTMVPVRTVFDLSHDLGSVRRFFTSSEDGQQKARDLRERDDWWNLPQDQRAKQLRDYWKNNLVPRDVQLSQESNRVFSTLDRELEDPFLTTKKKRVFVSTSRDVDQPGKWEFEIPSRSYEVWTLLCWRDRDRTLHDFLIPQKVFSSDFAIAKKSLKKDEKIPISIQRTEGNHFFLSIAGKTGKDITVLQSDYEPLQ